MGVSYDHELLVGQIVNWINANHSIENARIFVDKIDVLGAAKPKAIYGYIPDVFCMLRSSGFPIIGDAKTPNDLEAIHTRLQLEAFMKHLSLLGGGKLVVATTWASANSAKAILRRVRDKFGSPNIEILVLDQASQQEDIDVAVDRPE